MYNLKSTSVKGTPDYVISKLLMNSLYGKFGADPLMETHSVIDSNKSDEYNRKYIVTDEIDLKNGKELISFFKDSGQFDNHKLSQKNSSISIALAVTAYARIHMSLAPRLKQIAIDSGLTIFYMDTDSIAFSGSLAGNFVSNKK